MKPNALPKKYRAQVKAALEKPTEIWCPLCGKWGDHGSAQCRDINPPAKKDNRNVTQYQRPADHCALSPRIKAFKGMGGACFTVLGKPMGKPRMTRCDKWKKRDCVVRYRAWADSIRAACPPYNFIPATLIVTAHFAMPASWSEKKKREMAGKPHQSKPDADNVAKGIMDALIVNDQCIHTLTIRKLWAEPFTAARAEITLET